MDTFAESTAQRLADSLARYRRQIDAMEAIVRHSPSSAYPEIIPEAIQLAATIHTLPARLIELEKALVKAEAADVRVTPWVYTKAEDDKAMDALLGDIEGQSRRTMLATAARMGN